MAKEPQLKPLSGASRLGLGFFNSLINRIECTKPLAGANISISELANGFMISGVGGGAGSREITLNVCSNGSPDTITVYGPA